MIKVSKRKKIERNRNKQVIQHTLPAECAKACGLKSLDEAMRYLNKARSTLVDIYAKDPLFFEALMLGVARSKEMAKFISASQD